MKKHASLLLAVGAASLACSLPAQAQLRRPVAAAPASYGYLFGEFDYFNATGGSMNGGGLGGGWRINRFLALEGGGQYGTKSGVDLKGGYAQAVLLLPVGSRLALSASIGGTYLQASTKVGTTTVSTNSSGYRAGVGLEYWLSNNWGLRLGAHRQNAGGVLDDFSAGFAYRF